MTFPFRFHSLSERQTPAQGPSDYEMWWIVHWPGKASPLRGRRPNLVRIRSHPAHLQATPDLRMFGIPEKNSFAARFLANQNVEKAGSLAGEDRRPEARG